MKHLNTFFWLKALVICLLLSPMLLIAQGNIPGAQQSYKINDSLTVTADKITKVQYNNDRWIYKLEGNVILNGILMLGGTIDLDTTATTTDPKITGYHDISIKDVPTVGNNYIIKEDNQKEYNYYIKYSHLTPGFFTGILPSVETICGFNTKIGELIVDPAGKYVQIKYEVEFGFPLSNVMAYVKKTCGNKVPLYVDKVSASKKYSQLTGITTQCDIKNLSVNLGVVSVKNLKIYWNTETQLFGGGFEFSIPGPLFAGDTTKSLGNADSLNQLNQLFGNLPVEIRNPGGQKIDSMSLGDFTRKMSTGANASLLSFSMDLEFTDKGLNKLIVKFGVKIPLGPTGLFLTKIEGGVSDLQTQKWKIIAKVDIDFGIEVPILGSAFKLKGIGLTLQPWNEFKAGGELTIFGQKIADGHIGYNVGKGALDLGYHWNVADIIVGGMDLSVKSWKVNGSGSNTLKTPTNLPWFLWFIKNKTIGNMNAELNNQYVQGQFKLFWFIKGAAKLGFDNASFPWFHFYLGGNLQSLHKLFIKSTDSGHEEDFRVPENTNDLIVFARDTITPALYDYWLVDPTGKIIDKNNASCYQTNDVALQTNMAVKHPMKGDWKFKTNYTGNVAVIFMMDNQEPSVLAKTPASKQSLSNEISLDFNDYADTLAVEVYYDTDNKGFNGTLIDQFTVINNASLNFTWENEDVPAGEYYIYTRVDDGSNAPVLQYAPGSIQVFNDDYIETPSNFKAQQPNDTSILVSWDKPQAIDIAATIVYYKDLSTERIIQEAVSDTNQDVLINLTNGRGYEMWCKYIDENGEYSPISNTETIVFTRAGQNNPPFFMMDPEKEYAFITGVKSEYKLTAMDGDKQALTYQFLGDTLGLVLNGNKWSWTPANDQIGDFTVKVVVSDGSGGTDTTSLDIIVYTADDIAVSLDFSSPILYQNDNMFITINNYLNKEKSESVTLTNLRTGQKNIVFCSKVDDFESMGEFNLDYTSEKALSVKKGDSIKASYTYNKVEYTDIAVYDSLPQPSDLTPPSRINDLVAEKLAGDTIRLSWTAPSDNGPDQSAFSYDIRYASQKIDSLNPYLRATEVKYSPYPAAPGVRDSLIISLDELPGCCLKDSLYFSLRSDDVYGNISAISNSAGIKLRNAQSIPGVSGENAGTHVGDPYPNPFGTSTMIPVYSDGKAQINSRIYNSLGHVVREMEETKKESGRCDLSVKRENLSAGIYLIVIDIYTTVSEFKRVTKKLVIE